MKNAIVYQNGMHKRYHTPCPYSNSSAPKFKPWAYWILFYSIEAIIRCKAEWCNRPLKIDNHNKYQIIHFKVFLSPTWMHHPFIHGMQFLDMTDNSQHYSKMTLELLSRILELLSEESCCSWYSNMCCFPGKIQKPCNGQVWDNSPTGKKIFLQILILLL